MLHRTQLIAVPCLCFPTEPKFEGVRPPTTLNSFVASIIAHVVVFVRLEQVLRAHVVACAKHTLNKKCTKSLIDKDIFNPLD